MPLSTAGKSDHEITLERLLLDLVEQIKALRATVGATSVAPVGSAAPRTSRSSSADVPAPSNRRLVTQSSNKPMLTNTRTSSAARAVVEAPNYECVPWFIKDFCRKYAGRTITCRAIADAASVIYKRSKVTESQLKHVAEAYPDLIKLVKTDVYEDSVYTGNKVSIAPATNSNRKRLSAIRIY